MDLRGGHRRTPLIEEPRRPPWLWILILVLAGTAVAWAATNADIDFERFIPKPERIETRTSEVVEAERATRDPGPTPAPDVREGAAVRWAVQPTPRYPEAGLAVGHARVRLGCFVQPDFSLGQCVVLQETPPGYGFGASALASVRDARVTSDSPVGARVDFSMRYVPPDE